MPLSNVPFHERTVPRHLVVPAGTTLWRLNRADPDDDAAGGRTATRSLFRAGSREPGRSRPARGGRFDPCRDHDYSYSYLALDDLTALAETLLRDTEFDGERRPVLAADVRGRRLVLMEARRELTLISLVSLHDLAAARQDTWLVQATPENYSVTRCWGHWLRDCSRAADGMVWRSRCNPDGFVVLLFGDRCEGKVEPSALGFRSLDDAAGLDWLNRRLALMQTYVGGEYLDQEGTAS